MTRFRTTLCAVLAATFAAGTALPAVAAPVIQPVAPAASDMQPIQVQTQRQERRFERRQERRERRFERRQDRREARFERRNGNPYYGNYRGYRERRSGYREFNGFWFPAAAFVTGAIVGGAISGGTSGGGSHVVWCNDRWRSYRASDNSYQPTNGPRRACISPYS